MGKIELPPALAMVSIKNMRQRSFMAIFIGIIALNSAKFSLAKENEDSFYYGTLTSDCKCQRGYFTTADMESTSSEVKLKKGDRLKGMCQIRSGSVTCWEKQTDEQATGGTTCPRECLELKIRPKLTPAEAAARARAAAITKRGNYEKVLPRGIIAGLDAGIPGWLPAIRVSGYEEYQPEYELLGTVSLKVPELTSKGPDYTWLVFIFKNIESLLGQNLTAVRLDKTGKILKSFSNPQMQGSLGPYRYDASIGAYPMQEFILVLRGTHAGPSDAAEVEPVYIPPVAEIEKTRDLKDLPAYGLPRFGEIEFSPSPFLLRLIDGPATLRSLPNEKAPAIGTCVDMAPALLSQALNYWPEMTKHPWYPVFCGGKSGWTHEKNLRALPPEWTANL